MGPVALALTDQPLSVVSLINDGVVCFGGRPLPYRFPTDIELGKQANYVNALNTYIRYRTEL